MPTSLPCARLLQAGGFRHLPVVIFVSEITSLLGRAEAAFDKSDQPREVTLISFLHGLNIS